MNNITYIIPTIGRPSLWPLCKAILKQLTEFDRLIIGSDGADIYDPVIHDERITFFKTDRSANGGSFQRNRAIGLLRTSHVLFLDDDDMICDGAVDTIRSAISREPNKPILFRCHHDGGLIWKFKELAQSNISTQCICFPTHTIGYWSNRYESDYDFIRSTVDKYPNKDSDIIWREEVIAHHNFKL